MKDTSKSAHITTLLNESRLILEERFKVRLLRKKKEEVLSIIRERVEGTFEDIESLLNAFIQQSGGRITYKGQACNKKERQLVEVQRQKKLKRKYKVSAILLNKMSPEIEHFLLNHDRRYRLIEEILINKNVDISNLSEEDVLDKFIKIHGYTTKKSLDKNFYSSQSWNILRAKTFAKYGNKCQCCGQSPKDGVVLHVDHIKPRSKYPELELDENNLQILCEQCNLGKLNLNEIDYR